MKKVVLSVVTIAILAVITIWAIGSAKSKEAAKHEWPANLGTLDEVPKRFPPAEQSAGATRLVQLASGANIDIKPKVKEDVPREVSRREAEGKRSAQRKAINDYLRVQFERSGNEIDAPPPVAAEYLDSHRVPLDDTRDFLLSGTPIVWDTKVTLGFEMPIPNLLGHMDLHRALLARGLDKARNNDPKAWDELRASWELNRGLRSRPDLISQPIALATTRMSNAAARKMPLPVPEWFKEVQSFDYLAAMASSQQAEAWAIRNLRFGKPDLRESSGIEYVKQLISWPLFAWQEAEALTALRRYTTEALRAKACDVNSDQFKVARASFATSHAAVPNMIEAWGRLLRFRAELEATDRILQIRAGQMPSTKSACSDGAWQVTANSIKFSRDIKVLPPGIKYPLAY